MDAIAIVIIAVLGVLLVAAAAAAVWLARRYLRLRADSDGYRASVPGLIRRACDAAIRQSKATRTGQAGQHLLPLLPDFEYEPSEVRFVGGTVDMLVFKGLSDPDADVEVVFLEVKTRRGNLSREQKRVREAVADRRVSFREYLLPRPEPEPSINLSRLAAAEVPPGELATAEELETKHGLVPVLFYDDGTPFAWEPAGQLEAGERDSRVRRRGKSQRLWSRRDRS